MQAQLSTRQPPFQASARLPRGLRALPSTLRPSDRAAMARLACSLLLLALCASSLAGGAVADDRGDDESAGPVLVTCGSVIKLEAGNTRHVLHSHEISYGYGRGSGQQSVTGFPEKDQANSLWIVRSEGCLQGTPIKKGTELRLQHVATRRWLHSHKFSSPLTNNQEVSAFGDDSNSDLGDAWQIEWDGSEPHWLRDAPVRFRHKTTQVFLGNHKVLYQRPIPGQSEVFGVLEKGSHAVWRATEGAYVVKRADS